MIWHPSLTTLLEELADEAQLRTKLHSKIGTWYASRNKRYHLPIIIFSVLSGSGNFVSGQFKAIEKWLILGIGCLSIFTSIISAIAQFLKLSELATEHRIASLSWGKFFATLRIQLQLKKADRAEPREFLNSVVSEYERLFEISPPLLNNFVDKIIKKVQNMEHNRFKMPFYCNGFYGVRSFEEESFDNNTVELTIEDEKKDHDD